MTRDEQVWFVKHLSETVTAEVIKAIEGGMVPETWDGIELRWLLSDKFQEQRPIVGNQPRKRYNDYTNEVIVRNL